MVDPFELNPGDVFVYDVLVYDTRAQTRLIHRHVFTVVRIVRRSRASLGRVDLIATCAHGPVDICPYKGFQSLVGGWSFATEQMHLVDDDSDLAMLVLAGNAGSN